MRIGVIQTAYLGDLILTTPLLRELRRLRPEARLVVVTSPVGGEVFRLSPRVDEIWVQRKRPTWNSLAATWRLGRRLHAARFDVMIAAHRSHRSGWLIRAARAGLSIGFDDAPGAWAYDTCVRRDQAVHAVRRYLALAEPLGSVGESIDATPELRFSTAAERHVDCLLAAENVDVAEPLVCLAPGSIWPTKRWPAEGYAEVAAAADERGFRPLLIGSQGELGLCDRVLKLTTSRARNLAGRTSIEELAALLARSRAAVCNDSGVAHVASAVGTPVVSVFGPTSSRHGMTPYAVPNRVVELEGLACRPCGRHGSRRCPLGHFRCMLGIEPARVADQLDAAIRASERVA